MLQSDRAGDPIGNPSVILCKFFWFPLLSEVGTLVGWFVWVCLYVFCEVGIYEAISVANCCFGGGRD